MKSLIRCFGGPGTSDGYDNSFQLIVKLLVIAHVRGESVTFRWQSL